ncbi:MAG: hypothetical protein LBO77_01830 [Desulfovibrio sp.]|jgi:PAS domain-containing protein|nr:hypothetical protein [Desulfovibrio sp.]
MHPSPGEALQQKLLQALHLARARVRRLERLVAYNSTLLGTGVDLEETTLAAPPEKDALRDALEALGMAGLEEDLSDYLGRDGDEESRPRLTDAPDSLKPASRPRLRPDMGRLLAEPPGRSIRLPGGPEENTTAEGPCAFTAAESGSGEGVPSGDEGSPGPLSSGSGIDPDLLAEYPLERILALPGPGKAQPGDVPPGLNLLPGEVIAGPDEFPPFPSPTPDPPPAPPEPSPGGTAEDSFLAVLQALLPAGDGLWDWDLRTGRVFASERWREILAPSPETAPAASPLEGLARCLHPSEAAALLAAGEGLLAGTLPRLSLEVRFRRSGAGRLRAVCLRRGGRAARLTATLMPLSGEKITPAPR